MTVLPRSRKDFKTFINLIVSLECNPMLGSSKIYRDPTRLLGHEKTQRNISICNLLILFLFLNVEQCPYLRILDFI